MPDKTSAVPGPILDKYMQTPAVDAAKGGVPNPALQSSARRMLDAWQRCQNVNVDKIMSDRVPGIYC